MARLAVRATDKRIQCDEEFSDSEDEGEGGRRDRHTSRAAPRPMDGGIGVCRLGIGERVAGPEGFCAIVVSDNWSMFLISSVADDICWKPRACCLWRCVVCEGFGCHDNGVCFVFMHRCHARTSYAGRVGGSPAGLQHGRGPVPSVKRPSGAEVWGNMRRKGVLRRPILAYAQYCV